MPLYDLKCDNCGHQFEIHKKFHDPLPKKCPECGKLKLYQEYSVYGTVQQEPTTLGQLADRNTQKMSSAELEERRRQHTENLTGAKPATWYNPDRKNLKEELKTVNTPAKRLKYIMEGKK